MFRSIFYDCYILECSFKFVNTRRDFNEGGEILSRYVGGEDFTKINVGRKDLSVRDGVTHRQPTTPRVRLWTVHHESFEQQSVRESTKRCPEDRNSREETGRDGKGREHPVTALRSAPDYAPIRSIQPRTQQAAASWHAGRL